MKFFFDHNLSPYIARAISCLLEPDGSRAVALADKFPRAASDEEWISALSRESEWVVLTSDYDIVRRAALRATFKASGLIGFVLRPAWQDFAPMEQAWRLIKQWPTITAQCAIAAPGSTYELGIRGGKIRTL